jgi:hypothetical protein
MKIQLYPVIVPVLTTVAAFLGRLAARAFTSIGEISIFNYGHIDEIDTVIMVGVSRGFSGIAKRTPFYWHGVTQ